MSSSGIPAWRKPLDSIFSSRLGSAFHRRFGPLVDRPLMRLSRGRLALTFGMPTLLLTTIGRRSGEPRSTPLLYFRYEDSLAVIGTRFGSPQQPHWYLNIRKTPEATVLLGGEEFKVSAHDANPAEREKLWALATRAYGGFEKYKARIVAREIPIVILSRIQSD